MSSCSRPWRACAESDPAAPEALVAALTARPEPGCQSVALDLTRRCLQQGLLSPERARACLEALLGAASPVVVAGALRELAAPWALTAPLQIAHLSPHFGAEPMVAEAALALAARHGYEAPLRGVLDAADGAPRRRQWALEQLGAIATRDDIGELLGVASSDPLLFGPPLLACLRALHRRGHFPAPEHARALLDLALADHTLSAAGIAAVAYTCRQALFDAVRAAPAGDATWPRRLAILVAMAAQGPGDLPIGELVTEKLRESADPAPFLRAIAALRWAGAEQHVIAMLARAPADALDALRTMGGRRTVEALRAGLGLDGDGDVAPHLRAEREWAVALLWHLSEAPDERRALLARLDPRHLPAHVAADLGVADDAELRLLAHAVADATPALALQALARVGDARALPAIADLLLRITGELAAAWASGTETATPPPRELGSRERPAQPVLPPEVGEAVRALGRRLHQRRKIRPACLLDATNEKEAGDALLASLLLDLLDRPEPSPPERAILLDALLSAPWRRTVPRVHRLLRHRDPRVRKGAIALLARDGAEALSASLTLLTGAGDVQTARQALLALGAMKARWAAGAIAACLEHPNMNVKKTAAEALAGAGAPEVVPRLLFWLGRHDNPGFRALLEAALQAILGPGYRATLLAAAEATDHARTRDLLLDALGGQLSPAAVRQLVRQGWRAAPRLVARILAGELALAAGARALDLAAEIDALGLPAPEPEAPVTPRSGAREARALVRDGWSDVLARRLPGAARAPRRAGDRGALAAAPPVAPLRPRRAGAERGSAPPGGPPGRERSGVGVARPGAAHRGRPRRHGGGRRRAPGRSAGAPRDCRPRAAASRGALGRGARPRSPARARIAKIGARAPGARPRPARARRRRASARRRGRRRRSVEGAARPSAPGVRRERRHAPCRRRRRERRRRLPRGAPGRAPGPRGALLTPGGRRCSGLARAAVGPDRRLPGGDGHRARPPPRLDGSVAAPRRPAVDPGRAASAASQSRGRRAPTISISPAPPRSAPASWRWSAPAPPRPRPRLSWPEKTMPSSPCSMRTSAARWICASTAPSRGSGLVSPAKSSWATAELWTRHAANGSPDCSPGSSRQSSSSSSPCSSPSWQSPRPARHDAATRAIRRIAPDVRAACLLPFLEQGAWGMLDLLHGAPLLRTPALTAIADRLRRDGRRDLADQLLFVDGPVRDRRGEGDDEHRLAALRAPPPVVPEAASEEPSLAEHLRRARGDDAELARRALTELARSRDAELAPLLEELVADRRPRLRLHAHRLLRDATDRATYLRASTALLADPLPDVVRSALRILCFASWLPAIPAIVDLLLHPHASVRRAAADGLVQIGAPAVPALRSALSRARPDRREVYEDVLRRVEPR